MTNYDDSHRGYTHEHNICVLLEHREKSISACEEIIYYTKEIQNYLIKHKDNFEIDFLIETLTKMGETPNIISYNNKYACISNTNKTINILEIDDIYWKNNIRESINDFIDKYKIKQL